MSPPAPLHPFRDTEGRPVPVFCNRSVTYVPGRRSRTASRTWKSLRHIAIRERCKHMDDERRLLQVQSPHHARHVMRSIATFSGAARLASGDALEAFVDQLFEYGLITDARLFGETFRRVEIALRQAKRNRRRHRGARFSDQLFQSFHSGRAVRRSVSKPDRSLTRCRF